MEKTENKRKYLLALLFATCAGAFCAFFPRATERNLIFIFANIALACVCAFFLDLRYGISERAIARRAVPLIVGIALVSLFTACIFSGYCAEWGWTRLAFALIPFGAYFLYAVICRLYDLCLPFLRSAVSHRRGLIAFGAASACFLVLSIVLCASTNVFYRPFGEGDEGLRFDILFTSDTANIYVNDAFLNMQNTQNDLRQFWFPFLAMPFAVPAKLLSYVFFFVEDSYAIFLIWMQLNALLGAALLFAACLRLGSAEACAFSALFFACFAQLFFGLVIEQYIFPLFWTALFALAYCNARRETAALYAFGVGGFLTSGILLPFVYRSDMKWKGALKALGEIVFLGVSLFLLAGRLPTLRPDLLAEKLNDIFQFTGKDMTMSETFSMFTHYVVYQFAAPQIVVSLEGFPAIALPETSGVSVAGICILAAELFCFLASRREKLAWLGLFWIAFSALLLGVMGWGASENGMVLYASYFCWAYLLLPCLALKQTFPNAERKRTVLFASLCGAAAVGLLAYNAAALVEVMQFALQYYPA